MVWSSSAGAYPFPLVVMTWSSLGPGMEVAESERVEQRQGPAFGADEAALGVFDDFLDPAADPAGAQAVPYALLETVVALGGGHPEQVVVQGADILVDGDLVVVEDHQQVGVQASGVVEALEGQAARHGAVADDGDHVLVLPFQLRGYGHAQRR